MNTATKTGRPRSRNDKRRLAASLVALVPLAAFPAMARASDHLDFW